MSDSSDKPSAAYLAQNRGPQVITVAAVMASLASLAVIGRLVARKIKINHTYGVDDLFCVLALLIAWAFAGTCVWAMNNNGGKHIEVVSKSESDTMVQHKANFIFDLTYISALACVKISILFFYRRIFVQRSLVIGTYVIGTLIVMWWLADNFVGIFSCWPVQKQWDKSIEGTCTVDTAEYILAANVSHIVFDGFILLLPMPTVWSLNLPIRKKIAVSGIFALGAFVTVVGGIRLSVIESLGDDFWWDLSSVSIWSNIELNLAIICACLPTLLPLLLWALNKAGLMTTKSSPYYRKGASKERYRELSDPASGGQQNQQQPRRTPQPGWHSALVSVDEYSKDKVGVFETTTKSWTTNLPPTASSDEELDSTLSEPAGETLEMDAIYVKRDVTVHHEPV